MRYPIFIAALVACGVAASSAAVAFDVQNGGGQAAGSVNLAPDPSSVPGVSLDDDLRAQLGLANDKASAEAKATAGSGLQFSGGIFSGQSTVNSSSMGYVDSPWVAPRAKPGSN
jgi:hypothetical protein